MEGFDLHAAVSQPSTAAAEPRWFAVRAAARCGLSRLRRRGLEPASLGVIIDPDTAQEAPSRAVSTQCNNCGGALKVDGTSRSVDCEFCSTTNILPDHVWRIFHPPRALRRFWLIFDTPALSRELPGRDISETFTFWFMTLLGLSVGGGFFIPGILAILGLMSVGSSDELFWRLLFGIIFAAVGVVPFFWTLYYIVVSLIRSRRRDRIVRAEHEVVGRMRQVSTSGDKVTVSVELFDSQGQPQGQGGEHRLSKEDFERLGGEGGTVRAFASAANPSGRERHVFFAPSPLL